MLSLTGWTSQQIRELEWDRVVRLMYVWVNICQQASHYLLKSQLLSLYCEPKFFILSLCIALLMSFFICLPTLTSHLLLLLKVLIPRFSVELLRQTEAAALSFASELRETGEERKRQKRGRYGGQTHPCLKRGFCREPQAGCQVCRWCTSGSFLTLWE